MVKIQENVIHKDTPEKAITMQCLNTMIKVAKAAWERKEETIQNVQEDAPVKVMFQPASKW